MSKGIGVTKSKFLRELISSDFTGFHTGFSQKKINEFLIFVIFDVLFVDLRHILDNCTSQGLPLEEWMNLLNFLIL